MEHTEKAIVILPGQLPQIIGNWKLGELYQAAELLKAYLDNQEVIGAPAQQPESPAEGEPQGE
jgi:hypothetical protein